MTRRPFVAANWKMNHGVEQTIKFITEFTRNLNVEPDAIDIVICPPYTSLYTLSIALQENNLVAIGAQNCHFEDNGAFTGEISTDFLTEISCDYVIIGHSERRQYFQETDDLLNKKLKKVFEKKMFPIFCVGETEAQREEGKTFEVIETQLTRGLMGLTKDQIGELVIAYEPVWAIGTGKTATPEQAQEVHAFIRKEIAKSAGTSYAAETRILYGGSVKPDNTKELMIQEDIDGALVGGAALKPDSFLDIVNKSK